MDALLVNVWPRGFPMVLTPPLYQEDTQLLVNNVTFVSILAFVLVVFFLKSFFNLHP